MSMSLRVVVFGAALVALSIGLASASQARQIDFWSISAFHYNPREPFEPAPTRAVNTIPAEVRALDGKTVEIYGNAMALDYSSGMMSEFILQMSADNCGFGAVPRINEWIQVRMVGGKQVRVSTALDVKMTNTFRIREQLEGGFVVGLYHIDADRVQ